MDANSTAVVTDNDRRRRPAGVAPALLLIVAGGLVYANSLSAPFVFDDRASIIEDRDIRSLANLSTVLSDTNRPIVKLSLAVNYAIGELDVTGYHVVNIAIHILAAMVLFGIVRRTLLSESLRERFERSAPWLAFAVALVWLLHPLQTQAVTYTIQRSEALMGSRLGAHLGIFLGARRADLRRDVANDFRLAGDLGFRHARIAGYHQHIRQGLGGDLGFQVRRTFRGCNRLAAGQVRCVETGSTQPLNEH